MVFSWLRQRRRRRILSQPFPPAWLEYLRQNVAHYRFLSESEKSKLRDDIRIFIEEKNWEGCGGLQMTDEIKVTIAAMACLLVLGMEHNYFDRVKSILVYPTAYVAPESTDRGTGIVDEMGEARLGEAWYRGPVVLSWDEARADGRLRHRGHNVVFHEFAHQLDMLDGAIDGTPPLASAKESQRWHNVMTAEYERLVRKAEEGRATLLDSYGATNEGEFFAVATECFFERPVEMSTRHPQLYELLRDYYKQDPAKRCVNQTSS
jgi:Mlc titration factor MtfA (ptsG expression regulator)